MRTEKQLQTYLMKEVRRNGGLAYKWASPGRRGVPDLILVGKAGTVVFVEVKSPIGDVRLSPLQKLEMSRLIDRGCYAILCASEIRADEIILALKDDGEEKPCLILPH